MTDSSPTVTRRELSDALAQMPLDERIAFAKDISARVMETLKTDESTRGSLTYDELNNPLLSRAVGNGILKASSELTMGDDSQKRADDLKRRSSNAGKSEIPRIEAEAQRHHAEAHVSVNQTLESLIADPRGFEILSQQFTRDANGGLIAAPHHGDREMFQRLQPCHDHQDEVARVANDLKSSTNLPTIGGAVGGMFSKDGSQLGVDASNRVAEFLAEQFVDAKELTGKTAPSCPADDKNALSNGPLDAPYTPPQPDRGNGPAPRR